MATPAGDLTLSLTSTICIEFRVALKLKVTVSLQPARENFAAPGVELFAPAR